MRVGDSLRAALRTNRSRCSYLAEGLVQLATPADATIPRDTLPSVASNGCMLVSRTAIKAPIVRHKTAIM
jgi:hypothetical protein